MQPNNYPKVSVSLSRKRDFLIASDDQGQRMIMPVNLVKHALEIPYTKKDGTEKKLEDILMDKVRAQEARQKAMAGSMDHMDEVESL